MDAGSWKAHWGKRKLEQDERNKLLRVDGWSLDIEPASGAGNEDRHGQMCKAYRRGMLLHSMVAAEGATWVDIEINVTSLVSIRSQDVWTCRRGWNARRWMQQLCLKNCDQDAAGPKLENLSKGGMVWEQTVYRKGFLPCCMLAASAAKAPRLAIPLASSNELTNEPSWGLRNRCC